MKVYHVMDVEHILLLGFDTSVPDVMILIYVNLVKRKEFIQLIIH